MNCGSKHWAIAPQIAGVNSCEAGICFKLNSTSALSRHERHRMHIVVSSAAAAILRNLADARFSG